jgi:hypothetical protein
MAWGRASGRSSDLSKAPSTATLLEQTLSTMGNSSELWSAPATDRLMDSSSAPSSGQSKAQPWGLRKALETAHQMALLLAPMMVLKMVRQSAQ